MENKTKFLSNSICDAEVVKWVQEHAYQISGLSAHAFSGFWPKVTAITQQHVVSGDTNCHGTSSLQWRHNGRNGISNHQPHDCLLKH